MIPLLLSAVTAFAAALPSSQEQPVASLQEQAQELEKRGQLFEAQKIYRQMFEEANAPSGEIQEAKKHYEDLNIQILFSNLETSDSQIYAVEPGDTLYEIAKKFQTTQELIQKSNQLSGDKIGIGMKLKVIRGTFSIGIDKSENLLTLYLNGKPLKHYPIATGQNNKTPAGTFKIIHKIENPTWYKPQGGVIPSGSPENRLGSRWLGFDQPGYGIHGTKDPESIGKPVSSGCIRMFNQDVEELYLIVPQGTQVSIKD